MAMNPKQLLLEHVEKVVLVLAVGVLIWAVWAYPPWVEPNPLADRIGKDMSAITERKKVEYTDDLDLAAKDPNKHVPPGVERVRDYVWMIEKSIQQPWSNPQEVTKYDPTWVIFEDDIGTPWKKVVPQPPVVLGPTEVLAKAEKNRVIVIFKLDQAPQRRILAETRVREYERGLPFEQVIITRQNMSGNEPPEQLTNKGWLPTGIGRMYGAPSDTGGGGSRLDEPMPWGNTGNVVMFSQREVAQMDPERRRFEEELRRQGETGGRPAPTAPVAPVTPTVPPRRGGRPGPTGADKTVVMGADEQYFWFVDNDVETEGKYKYMVTLVVKNPAYKSPAYERADTVPEFITSTATSSGEVAVVPFKEWHFSGGAQATEQAWCVVRVLTTEERKLDNAAVLALVAQMKQGVAVTETPGEWVKERFPVKPGEEVGGLKTVKLAGGQTVEVDFSTGIQSVLVSEGFQVTEDERTRLQPGADGKLEQVKVVMRTVVPKLEITVMDRKGNVYRKWQETVRDN